MEALAPVAEHFVGYKWVQRLLAVGLATKFPDAVDVSTESSGAIEPPVVIVVGGAHPDVETKMQAYRDLLFEAFAGFRGTVLCGGTKQGVPGIIGGSQGALIGS